MASRRLKILSRHLIRASISNKTNIALRNTSVEATGNATSFQYTVDSCMLTDEQRQFYETNGFLVVKGLVKRDDLEKYANRLDCLNAWIQ